MIEIISKFVRPKTIYCCSFSTGIESPEHNLPLCCPMLILARSVLRDVPFTSGRGGRTLHIVEHYLIEHCCVHQRQPVRERAMEKQNTYYCIAITIM